VLQDGADNQGTRCTRCLRLSCSRRRLGVAALDGIVQPDESKIGLTRLIEVNVLSDAQTELGLREETLVAELDAVARSDADA
ncbi:MAG: hypothetical protein JWP99_880, partial [Devosia sp.]|nr:hypothetical protein [Devosia sp.]